jgi:hypothetical protein
MKPEELLQRIAKLESADEKIKFLKSLLAQVEDKQTKIAIEAIIKQLETQKKEKKEDEPEDIEQIVSDVPTGTSAAMPQTEPLKLEDYKAPPESIETEVEPERPPEAGELLAERRESLPSYLTTEAALREDMEQRVQEDREEAMAEYERMLEERRGMRDLSDRIKFSRTNWDLQSRDLAPAQAQDLNDERYRASSAEENLGELTDRIKWHHRENHLTERKLDKYKRKDEAW